MRNPGHVFLVLFTPHERKPCLGGGKDARPASGGHHLDACEGPASCCAWTSSRRESQGIRPVAPQQAFLWSLCRPPPPVPPLPLPQRRAYKRTLTITVPFLKSAEVSFCSQRKISSRSLGPLWGCSFSRPPSIFQILHLSSSGPHSFVVLAGKRIPDLPFLTSPFRQLPPKSVAKQGEFRVSQPQERMEFCHLQHHGWTCRVLC